MREFLALEAAPLEALERLERLGGEKLGEQVGRWRRRLGLLSKAGLPLDQARFGAGFGRAFGYYDGALFEVRSAALGDERPIAAGGRYDGLAARLGGEGQAAAGCMVRPARAYAEGSE